MSDENPILSLPQDALAIILARFDRLEGRLDSMEVTVDKRLKETRTIWENVNA